MREECQGKTLGKALTLIPYPPHQSPNTCHPERSACEIRSPRKSVARSRRTPSECSLAMRPEGVLTRIAFAQDAGFEDPSSEGPSYVTVRRLLLLGTPGTGKFKLKRSRGQGHGENSLRLHGQVQPLAVLRLRAYHFRETPARLGASLRMTQEKGHLNPLSLYKNEGGASHMQSLFASPQVISPAAEPAHRFTISAEALTMNTLTKERRETW
jgi:hypothetical protein